jgi:DNA-binding LacI/PurR family transcriptional regulator
MFVVGREGPQVKVAQSVHGWIRDGRFAPGEPLPPIRQLADDFDVNKGTVVRALNHLQKAGLVERQGRRLHVGKAVGRDDAAAPAASPLAGTILIATTVRDGSGVHRTPGWAADVVRGVVAATQQAGRHAMVVHPEALDDARLDSLATARPAGCILASCEPRTAQRLVQRMDQEGVQVCRFGDEVVGDDHPTVSGDHAAGAALLVHWLHDQGRRRILRYWPHAHDRQHRPPWLGRRDAGYEQAVAQLGLPCLEPVEFHRPDDSQLKGPQRFDQRARLAAGYLAPHLLGDNPVDALMAASDAQTFELAAAVRLLGKTPGRDVLITGYDDYADHADEHQFESTLPAATVSHDYIAIGRGLVSLVIDPDAGHPTEAPPQLRPLNVTPLPALNP